MNRYTSIFTNDSDKSSTLRALAISILSSLLFLFAFVSLYKPVVSKRQPVVRRGPTPAATPQPRQAEPPVDPNARFRVVPYNFKSVDFENWDYGRYRFGGQRLDLTLTSGDHLYEWEEGGGGQTFSLRDVFFKDVTGDGTRDAIVILSHVQCGGSCDGGSALFYIYETSKKGLRKVWEYETGSMAYGCGLRSLTVAKKEITLEMFGHCWRPASSFPVSGKFLVRDVTRSVFQFDGRSFVKKLTTITAAPAQDLRPYAPEVHIE